MYQCLSADQGSNSFPFLSHTRRGSKAVMHRIANPCRSVRLRPAPPNFSFEINKIAPLGAFCFVLFGVLSKALLDRNWTAKDISSLKRQQLLDSAMPRPMRMLGNFDNSDTPPYPHPPFSRWLLPDRVNHCSVAAIKKSQNLCPKLDNSAVWACSPAKLACAAQHPHSGGGPYKIQLEQTPPYPHPP